MKKTALTIVGTVTAILAVAPLAFAESSVSITNNGEGSSSSVNVTTNTGNNTICVNGKCTTSTGETGKSTVCVNGDCKTSDGDIKVESEDGNTKVNIKSNGTSSVKIDQKSNVSENATDEIEDALKKAKEAKKQADEIKKKADEKVKITKARIEKAKKEAEDSKFDIKKLVDEQLDFLRDIVTFKFLFGDK